MTDKKANDPSDDCPVADDFVASGFSDSNEGKEGVLSAQSEGDCVKVQWNVNNPRPGDWIGLFVHERKHDTNYLRCYQTNGEQFGETVFRKLCRGYYDVRFFQDGSTVRSPGFDMCVVCVGSPVRITVTRQNRRTLVVSWPPEYTDSSNWIGLFKATECGNRQRHSIACKYMKEAETAIAPKPRLLLPCPRTPGDYHVRFFLNGSISFAENNAYSGIALVTVPNEDKMVAKFDRSSMSLTVEWGAYSVDHTDWHWIGLYPNSTLQQNV